MSENTKKTYTADEFKGICRDMIPHLNGLLDAARKNGLDGGVYITVSADGYIDMKGGSCNGWELVRFKDAEDYTAWYTYSERITFGKEEAAND